MLKRFFIPLLLVLIAVAAALYFLGEDKGGRKSLREAVPVSTFTLSNGMQVVVMPNARIPAVTHILLVKAGGADDPYGKSGLAHFLEHLLFTGTTAYPEGVYDREIVRRGGEHNAYTTRDYTAYYVTIAKQFLPLIMSMEADRLQNLTWDEPTAKREREVITEERATRVENRPMALLSEQLDAITLLNHPYGQPLIGWAEDMATLSAEDAKAFFERYYRASNLVLVVAGDVEVGEVKELAKQYYGSMSPGKAPARVWPKEPPVRMTRHAEMEDEKANEPRLLRQYVAPSIREGKSEQLFALSLLSQYVGGGQTSLLYRRLVREQQLATSVSATYEGLSLGPAMFQVYATPVPGVSLRQLEEAIDRVIEEALGNLPDDAEVARAKTQLKAQVIYAQDGLTPLAQLIGALYMVGKDEQFFYGWAEAIEKVTAHQMLEAAQQVLDPARRVTGYLLPPAIAVPAPEPAPELIGPVQPEPPATEEAADALP